MKEEDQRHNQQQNQIQDIINEWKQEIKQHPIKHTLIFMGNAIAIFILLYIINYELHAMYTCEVINTEPLKNIQFQTTQTYKTIEIYDTNGNRLDKPQQNQTYNYYLEFYKKGIPNYLQLKCQFNPKIKNMIPI